MYHISVFAANMNFQVKKYGDTYKIIYDLRKGVNKFPYPFDEEREEHDGKQASNICRARSRIRELALCNDWEWFVTLTLNKDKQDRYDIDGFVHDLGIWIGNYNKKYGVKLRYVLIPEQHKDGAWHMHGLFHDVAANSVVRNDHGYWDIPYYSARFGYISLSPIRDKVKTSSYITKYISKDMNSTDIKKHKHLFYSSRGLEGAELVSEGECVELPKGVWCNDFVGIEWVDGSRVVEYVERLRRSFLVPLGNE